MIRLSTLKPSHVVAGFLILLIAVPSLCWMVSTYFLDPFSVNPGNAFAAPGPEAWVGRDRLGRDYLSRVLLGTGQSVIAASLAGAVALAVALAVGIVSGWKERGYADQILSFLNSLLFTVPFFLIAVAVGTVIQAGLFGIYLIVGLAMWAPAARLARAESIRIRRSHSAVAARAYGFTSWMIFRRVYLPQVTFAPAVSILYLFPELLGLDVGLAFFGLGATPPNPTLGRLTFEGIAAFPSAWWLVALPGAVLVFICLSCYALLHAKPATRP